MQSPRQTTEFQEQPSTATNSRMQPRSGPQSPEPNSGGRCTARESRIARPSSLDRQTLAVRSNSALHGSSATPQGTPTPTETLILEQYERQLNEAKRQLLEMDEFIEKGTKQLQQIEQTCSLV